MAPCFSLMQTTKPQPGNVFIGAIQCLLHKGRRVERKGGGGGQGREEGSAPPGMSTFNPHDHVVSL